MSFSANKLCCETARACFTILVPETIKRPQIYVILRFKHENILGDELETIFENCILMYFEQLSSYPYLFVKIAPQKFRLKDQGARDVTLRL